MATVGCLVVWLLGCLVAWLLLFGGCCCCSVTYERVCMSTAPQDLLCTTGGRTPECELPASAPTPSPRTLTPVSARGLQKIDYRKISNVENAENTGGS